MERWKYDGAKSLHDNLWSATEAAVYSFIKKNVRKVMSFSPAWPMEDVRNELLVRTFESTKKKVDEGWCNEHPGLTIFNCAFGNCLGWWGGLVERFSRENGRGLTHIEYNDEVEVRVLHSESAALPTVVDDVLDYLDFCEEFSVVPDRGVVLDELLDLPQLPPKKKYPQLERELEIIRKAKVRSYSNGRSVRENIKI